MTITEHTTDHEAPSRPSNPGSVLGNLRERREEIQAAQVIDLPVPRWESPKIVVRYVPLDHPYIRNKLNAVEKAPNKQKAEREVEANTDLLIKACVEVWAELDGKRYSLAPGTTMPEENLTRFDADLAANLGLVEDATARMVVRELFFTDGDIIATAQKIVEFSGYREQEANEELEGE